MVTRYERFNEMLFESYCKTCIDNAISKSQAGLEEIEEEHEDFFIRGNMFRVRNRRIGRALTYLLPRDREIILLYYFAEMNDDEIAAELRMSRATVQRRRTLAKLKSKDLLEGGI